MGVVVDYSFARPSAAELESVGATGVVRYVLGGGAKDITAAERESIRLPLALAAEVGPTDYLGGFQGGVNMGVAAVNAARQVGFPAGGAIYLTVDSDLPSSSDLDLAGAYVGAGTRAIAAGGYRAGVYGCGALLTSVHLSGLGVLLWRSMSTGWAGYDDVDPAWLALDQYGSGLGGAVDLSRSAADWGQWPPAPLGSVAAPASAQEPAAGGLLSPEEEESMHAVVLPSGEVAVYAIGAGSRAGQLLEFTRKPGDVAGTSNSVIDVTDQIGGPDPYTVSG